MIHGEKVFFFSQYDNMCQSVTIMLLVLCDDDAYSSTLGKFGTVLNILGCMHRKKETMVN